MPWRGEEAGDAAEEVSEAKWTRGQRPEEPRAAARWRKGPAEGSEGEEKPTTTPRAPLTRPEAQSRF